MGGGWLELPTKLNLKLRLGLANMNITDLAVALCPRALTHIYPAGFEIELWGHSLVTSREQTALDSSAVLVRSYAAVPVIPARRGVGGHVSGEHGARTASPNPPGVAKLLSGC